MSHHSLVVDEQTVIDAVRTRVARQHPGGVTLEVVPQGVRHEQDWWYVQVRPSSRPPKRYEYYESLAEVENELLRDEDLIVLLLPVPPDED